MAWKCRNRRHKVYHTLKSLPLYLPLKERTLSPAGKEWIEYEEIRKARRAAVTRLQSMFRRGITHARMWCLFYLVYIHIFLTIEIKLMISSAKSGSVGVRGRKHTYMRETKWTPIREEETDQTGENSVKVWVSERLLACECALACHHYKAATFSVNESHK